MSTKKENLSELNSFEFFKNSTINLVFIDDHWVHSINNHTKFYDESVIRVQIGKFRDLLCSKLKCGYKKWKDW